MTNWNKVGFGTATGTNIKLEIFLTLSQFSMNVIYGRSSLWLLNLY